MIGRSVQGNPVGLGVYAGAKKLGWIATQNGDRFEIASLKVLNQGERFSENEIRFVCEFNNDHADQPATFIPNQTLNNGDYRELGLFIAGMRFR